mmetsp:Transcript_15166/g.42161  ORF Transcript_15166/g.42161 Transcript_15166/m.42161 type:complete len:155 (-) Transcript_15166:541-1005(-)
MCHGQTEYGIGKSIRCDETKGNENKSLSVGCVFIILCSLPQRHDRSNPTQRNYLRTWPIPRRTTFRSDEYVDTHGNVHSVDGTSFNNRLIQQSSAIPVCLLSRTSILCDWLRGVAAYARSVVSNSIACTNIKQGNFGTRSVLSRLFDNLMQNNM